MAKKATTTTLEDFIKKYTSQGAKTYADFLRAEGDKSEDNYAYAERNADIAYDRARAGYGKTAERLASRGLAGGGYSAYLDANAYSEMQKSKREALERRNTSEKTNKIKYSDYLRDYEEKREKKLRDTVEKIAGYSPSDYGTAMEYAQISGLDGDIADIAANLGMEIGKPRKFTAKEKSTLINTLVSKDYSRGNLYYYLTAIGMSQDEANELADTIYKLAKSKKYSYSWD